MWEWIWTGVTDFSKLKLSVAGSVLTLSQKWGNKGGHKVLLVNEKLIQLSFQECQTDCHCEAYGLATRMCSKSFTGQITELKPFFYAAWNFWMKTVGNVQKTKRLKPSCELLVTVVALYMKQEVGQTLQEHHAKLRNILADDISFFKQGNIQVSCGQWTSGRIKSSDRRSSNDRTPANNCAPPNKWQLSCPH